MVFRSKRNLCILVHKHVVMSIRYLEFELFMSLCLRFVSQEEKNLVKCFKAIEKVPNINALNSSNQLYNEEKKMPNLPFNLIVFIVMNECGFKFFNSTFKSKKKC